MGDSKRRKKLDPDYGCSRPIPECVNVANVAWRLFTQYGRGFLVMEGKEDSDIRYNALVCPLAARIPSKITYVPISRFDKVYQSSEDNFSDGLTAVVRQLVSEYDPELQFVLVFRITLSDKVGFQTMILNSIVPPPDAQSTTRSNNVFFPKCENCKYYNILVPKDSQY